jgi:uncharacterized membrane-anchored protein YjiN (DUF445 family)
MDDVVQRTLALRKMQRIATGLLIVAAMVFVVSKIFEDASPILPFVRAFSEAAMIGALADWFAVTALFRHPLGIPIPHTAIVPARKERIAESFGRFIERNFLDADRIAMIIRRQDPALRLAGWLARPERSRQVADFVAESLGGILRVANDDDVGRLIATGLSDRLTNVPAAPMIGRLLGTVIAEQRQHEVLRQLVRTVATWVEQNEEAIRLRIAGELPTWVPRIVDQRIYGRLVDGLQRTLEDLERDSAHPLYEQFTLLVDRWIVNLQYDPDVRQRGEALKAELLEHPMLRDIAASVWQDLKAGLLAQSTMPDSPLRRSVEQGIVQIAATLANDPEWRTKIDQWAEEAARAIVQRYGRTAGDFVSNTVRSWDTDETTNRIELMFGRDLQFIRINGTIVGGLAGLVIYTISLWL